MQLSQNALFYSSTDVCVCVCFVHKYGMVWEIEATQCPLKEAETVEPTIGLLSDSIVLLIS
jgi:hypothetical protein